MFQTQRGAVPVTVQLARANVGVAAAGAAVEVAVQNMLDYAQAGGSPDTFDIALTSFAAHHLTPDEKAIFLKVHTSDCSEVSDLCYELIGWSTRD